MTVPECQAGTPSLTLKYRHQKEGTMMKHKWVRVKIRHLRKGRPRTAFGCPVALAIQEKLGLPEHSVWAAPATFSKKGTDFDLYDGEGLLRSAGRGSAAWPARLIMALVDDRRGPNWPAVPRPQAKWLALPFVLVPFRISYEPRERP